MRRMTISKPPAVTEREDVSAILLPSPTLSIFSENEIERRVTALVGTPPPGPEDTAATRTMAPDRPSLKLHTLVPNQKSILGAYTSADSSPIDWSMSPAYSAFARDNEWSLTLTQSKTSSQPRSSVSSDDTIGTVSTTSSLSTSDQDYRLLTAAPSHADYHSGEPLWVPFSRDPRGTASAHQPISAPATHANFVRFSRTRPPANDTSLSTALPQDHAAYMRGRYPLLTGQSLPHTRHSLAPGTVFQPSSVTHKPRLSQPPVQPNSSNDRSVTSLPSGQREQLYTYACASTPLLPTNAGDHIGIQPPRPRNSTPPSLATSQWSQMDIQSTMNALTAPPKLSLYKTELCRSWEEKGHCDYGTKCQFAHGAEELRFIQRHPKWKTELCRTYWRYGSCPYAKRCCFIHEVNESNTIPAEVKSPLLTRVRALSMHSPLSVTHGAYTS